MKRLAIAVAVLLCAITARAQLTTVTASSVKIGGVPIASGTVTFTPVNQQRQPIPFVTGGGGLNAPKAFKCQIASGAITGTCQVPDAAQTVPANILYSVEITDSASQSAFVMIVPGITGTTWPLDQYAPAANTTNVQPLQISYGTAAPTGSCVSPSLYVRNAQGGQLYICVGGSWVVVGGGGGGGTVSGQASGANFVPSLNNPIANTGQGYLEVAVNGTCTHLYGVSSGPQYVTATDANCENWSAPAAVPGLSSLLGGFSIVKSGSTYYMMIVDKQAPPSENVYLYSSTSLTSGWTVQNGGSPVFTSSSTVTNPYYNIYNPMFTIVGSTWFFWLEAGTQSAPDQGIGYSWSTGCPSSCNMATNMSAAHVWGIPTQGFFVNSPQAIYVPDRSAIDLIFAQSAYNGVAGSSWAVVGYSISSTTAASTPSTLATAGNWTQMPGLLMNFPTVTISGGISDPRIWFSPAAGLKNWNGIMQSSYNQGAGPKGGTWQYYTSFTLDQWHDVATAPLAPLQPTTYNPFYSTGSGVAVLQNSPALTGVVAFGPLAACGNQGANPGPGYFYWDGSSFRSGTFCSNLYLEAPSTNGVTVRPNNGANGLFTVMDNTGTNYTTVASSAGTQSIQTTGVFNLFAGSGNYINLGVGGGSGSTFIFGDGRVRSNAFQSAGTTFSVTGCGVATSLVGGSSAGKFVGASTTCNPVITMGGVTAANGWACHANDFTTNITFRQTATTTTTATMTSSGTAGATDTINFECIAY